jgi:hypothetical protein
MSLTSSIQTQIAFKNAFGKSQTDDLKDLVNELYNYSSDIHSSNVILDNLNPTASLAIIEGSVVLVRANLIPIQDSNGKSFRTFWPSVAPTGIDFRNNFNSLTYGVGSLSGISANQPLTRAVSDYYGITYQAIPMDSNGNRIYQLDYSDWVYQYNSGILYRKNTLSTTPSSILVYYYLGGRLSDTSTLNSIKRIRVSATGSNSYYSLTNSVPYISSYQSDHLYMVDFYTSNSSATVSLNINGIGTYSVYKNTIGGISKLNPNDISGTYSQVYYVLFNNNAFELYESNPISTLPNSLRSAKDTLTKLGGVESGTSFNDVKMQDVFYDLLYPENQPSFVYASVSNNSGYLAFNEVGSSLSPQTYTFSWSFINPFALIQNSLTIEDVTYVTSSQTYWNYPLPNPYIQNSNVNNGSIGISFGQTISSNQPQKRSYKISASRKNGTIISKNVDINWLWKIYYGTSTYSTLTASQILALTSSFATYSLGTIIVPGSGFKHFAFPDDSQYNFTDITLGGLPLAISGTSNGYNGVYLDNTYNTITVSNSFGLSKQYRLYSTINSISGTISVKFK